ncbi:MAG: ABC transporter permease subunit [Erysipelotrichaceae bacterium]|nr:ABC transporter permease subunit [Erysipelotrichaceae bacterium]
MKKESIITCALLIVLWGLMALFVHNDILLPGPLMTGERIVELLTQGSSYRYILVSLSRVIKGCFLSVLLAWGISLFSYYFPFVRRLFQPVYQLSKTIPNICYIILAIIWLGSEGSVMLVVFFVLFPMSYNQLMFNLDEEPEYLKDIALVYKEKFSYIFKKKILPSSLPTLLNLLKITLSFGFKIGVMAEIVAQANGGIGRQLSFARQNLDTVSIFAWTVIVVVLCVLIETGMDKLFQMFNKERRGI